MKRTYLGYVKKIWSFLLRGNIVDLAGVVVIGAAFGAIVTSFVNDIIISLILNPALKAARVQNIAQLSWNGVAYGSSWALWSTSLLLVLSFLRSESCRESSKTLVKEEAAEEELAALLKKSCLLKPATLCCKQ